MSEPGKLALRVAIAHDWLTGMYGAEQVVEQLLELFSPTPDLYTFHANHARLPAHLRAPIRRESRLAALPGLRERGASDGRWRRLLPLMPRFFESLDLRGYELLISSSHACAAGARAPAGVPHLVYCYTPMRYAWLPDAERGGFSTLEALGMRALRGRMRAWDLRTSARPSAYVAISSAVAERIERFYGRQAQVIHPPVATGSFAGPGTHDPTRFLWVGRFVAYKRPLEVVEAFARLPQLHLTMVGDGPLRVAVADHIERHGLTNVQLRDWLEPAQLVALCRASGAFVHLGEEDFGIAMVEAQSAGLPVLAPAAGGALDIVDQDSGVLLPADFSLADVASAAIAIAERDWDRAAISAGAERFSPERFREQITQLVSVMVSEQ